MYGAPVALTGPEAAGGVNALINMTLFLTYGMPDPQTGQNPNWKALGYPGPLGPPQNPPPKTLEPLEISQYRLALTIGVPPRRINEIVHGKRSIPADTALRLSRYFGTSAQFWLSLQDHYDLDVQMDRIEAELDEISPLRSA